jgi:hypothetical protein
MRITYIQLADIHKNRNDHEYIRESQTRSDLNRHLNKTKSVENTFYIDLYNKKADLKRYTDRTHIDIVG